MVSGYCYCMCLVENVFVEVKWICDNMLEVKELMFDDDIFIDDLLCVEVIVIGLGKFGIMWLCNVKVNVLYKMLKVMKENGLCLLLVGFELGDD